MACMTRKGPNKAKIGHWVSSFWGWKRGDSDGWWCLLVLIPPLEATASNFTAIKIIFTSCNDISILWLHVCHMSLLKLSDKNYHKLPWINNRTLEVQMQVSVVRVGFFWGLWRQICPTSACLSCRWYLFTSSSFCVCQISPFCEYY